MVYRQIVEKFLFTIIINSFYADYYAYAVDEFQSAFVQTGEELHYFLDPKQWGDGILTHVFVERSSEKSTPSEASNTNTNNNNKRREKTSALFTQLKFEPPVLEFSTRGVGIPELKKVKVYNPSLVSVRFEAISGSTVHFHCSFFEHKTIEAGSFTTFDVVFLPRQEGHIENTLFIHSSAGTFSYGVSGVGAPNPYRLRPFVGARVPLNGTVVESVDVYNPHSTTLKVTEVYSSGGDLHLELPGGDNQEASGSVWEIPPFQTQTVMKARFIGNRERNTTAYIRIKTNRPEKPALFIPVEVEVVSKPGLYAANQMLDFGTITSQEQSKWMTLNVYNTLNRSLQIIGIEVDVDAISVNFTPITISPNSRSSSCIAKLAYYGTKHADKSESKKSGFVRVKAQDLKYNLNVPYSVNVLSGNLYHDDDEVSFYVNSQAKTVSHNISLWNSFSMPIVVYNVAVSRQHRKMFQVSNFNSPVVLLPRDRTHMCTVSMNNKELSNHHYQIWRENGGASLRVSSNITTFDIPLRIYDGKLRYTLYSIDQASFDFGALDVNQERFILFAVTNENPISVELIHLTNAIPSHTRLELMGIEAGNHTVLAYNHQSPLDFDWKQGENFTVFANSFAVFRYSVKAPETKNSYFGVMDFATAYEKVEIPVRFTVTEGSLVSVPEKIVIKDAFPGKISSHALTVYSTFPSDIHVLRLSTLSSDPRFIFESFEKDQAPVIKPREKSQLGKIYFLPLATCMYDCYVGMPLDTEDGYHWVRGVKFLPDLPESDIYLYHKMYSKWRRLVDNNEHVVNSTVLLDSTQVKGFLMPVEARLSWPRLIESPAAYFPLTAVGNYTIMNLTLQNPSSLPVAVQMLPLTIYPSPEKFVELFAKELVDAPLTDFVEIDDVLMFSLRDSELYNARRESPFPMYRQALEQVLGTQIPRFTLSLLLQPGMQITIRIGFLPADFETRSSLLIIRNNLTVIETVTLYGRGAKMELRIANRPPHAVQPLMFEIQEKHLTECENIKRLQHKLPTSLTLRRSFVAKNTGELPLTIGNLTINGINCQNRGFRVLNCEPFTLNPNETHDLEIAFTPDFTLSWYEASLQLYLVGMHAPMVYSLGATIPRDRLPKCQAALPRPYWESLMYYSCVIALAFLLVCVVASAYLEGDRIITCALRRHYDIHARRVFDLNALNNAPLIPTTSAIAEKDKNRENSPKMEATKTAKTNKFNGDIAHPSLVKRLLQLLVSLIKERRLTRLADGMEDEHHQFNSNPNNKASMLAPPVSKQNAEPVKNKKTFVTSSTGYAASYTNQQNLSISGAVNPNLNQLQVTTTASMRQAVRKMSSSENNVETNNDDSSAALSGKNNSIIGGNNVINGYGAKKAAKSAKSRKNPVTSYSAATIARHMKESDVDEKISVPYDPSVNKNIENGFPVEKLSVDDDRSTLQLSGAILSGAENSADLSAEAVTDVKSAFVPVKSGQSRKKKRPDIVAAADVNVNRNRRNNNESSENSRLLYRNHGKNPLTSENERNFAKENSNILDESDDIALPEWDAISLSASDNQNIDEAFDTLACHTAKFAAELIDKESNNNTSSNNIKNVDKKGQQMMMTSQTSNKRSATTGGKKRWSSVSSLESSDDSSSPDTKQAPLHNTGKNPVLTSSSVMQRKKQLGNIIGINPLKDRSHHHHGQLIKGTNTSKVVGALPPKDPKHSSSSAASQSYSLHHTKPGGPRLMSGSEFTPVTAGSTSTDPTYPNNSVCGRTLMQQLRYERLQRLRNYQSQMRNADEDWPGFDLNPVVETLWDDDCDPWKESGPQQKNIWSNSYSSCDPVWTSPGEASNNTSGASVSGGASSSIHLFDLADTYNETLNRGWSPNDSIPFGHVTNVEEQIRRHSATLNSNNSPVPCGALAEHGQLSGGSTSTRFVTPPPPEDSSIVAWGPSVNPKNASSYITTANNIWIQSPSVNEAAGWPKPFLGENSSKK